MTQPNTTCTWCGNIIKSINENTVQKVETRTGHINYYCCEKCLNNAKAALKYSLCKSVNNLNTDKD